MRPEALFPCTRGLGLVDPLARRLNVAIEAMAILLETYNVVLEDHVDGEVSSPEEGDHPEDAAEEVVKTVKGGYRWFSIDLMNECWGLSSS